MLQPLQSHPVPTAEAVFAQASSLLAPLGSSTWAWRVAQALDAVTAMAREELAEAGAGRYRDSGGGVALGPGARPLRGIYDQRAAPIVQSSVGREALQRGLMRATPRMPFTLIEGSTAYVLPVPVNVEAFVMVAGAYTGRIGIGERILAHPLITDAALQKARLDSAAEELAYYTGLLLPQYDGDNGLSAEWAHEVMTSFTNLEVVGAFPTLASPPAVPTIYTKLGAAPTLPDPFVDVSSPSLVAQYAVLFTAAFEEEDPEQAMAALEGAKAAIEEWKADLMEKQAEWEAGVKMYMLNFENYASESQSSMLVYRTEVEGWYQKAKLDLERWMVQYVDGAIRRAEFTNKLILEAYTANQQARAGTSAEMRARLQLRLAGAKESVETFSKTYQTALQLCVPMPVQQAA